MSSAPLGSPALLPFPLQACVHLKGGGAFAPVIDSARQCRRQAGQRWALALRGCQAGQRLWPGRMMPEAPPGRFGTGPWAVRVTDVLARRARAWARGCPGPLDQTAVRDDIRHAGAPGDRVDGVEQHEAEELADTGHGWSQREGLRIVVLGGVPEGECQGLAQLVILGKKRQGDCHGLWSRGRGTALGNTVTLGFVGALGAHLGEGGWPVRMLDRSQQRRALTPQGGAAPQESTGGAHLGWIARGWLQQAAAQEYSNLVGSALVIVGRAAVERFQREGLTKDEGPTRRSAQGSEPVPGEETRHGHHQSVPRGCKSLPQWCRSGWHSAVEHDCSVRAHATDVHTAGVEVDATGKGVLVGVEAHEVAPLSPVLDSQCQQTTGVC
jgi:hypothetical protein